MTSKVRIFKDRSKQRRAASVMDPDCAICSSSATIQCDCEAKGLDTAVKLAEMKIMGAIYNDIRLWVRTQAQDYILGYYHSQAERRKERHRDHMDRLTAASYRHYRGPPQAHEIAAAQDTLKRGIDDDWRAAVHRYPEVLEYFFSQVEVKTPADTDPAILRPRIEAFSGARKSNRRSTPGLGGGGGGGRQSQQDLGRLPHQDLEPLPPPRREREQERVRERVREREREYIEERRTPGPPPSHRHSLRSQPPPGPPPVHYGPPPGLPGYYPGY